MILSDLVGAYRRAHNAMRNIDGLQPQESFDELLKYLFYKQITEEERAQAGKSAKEIRMQFANYVVCHNSWSTNLWRDRDFHLSDVCLEQCHNIFKDIHFAKVNYDLRSAALREFLTADIRKGLGIYLTPDEVVREIVRYVDPKPGDKCIDPACGSGTFLIEVVKHWHGKKHGKYKVWGADKNPRMLLIGELNLGHLGGASFSRSLMDSLVEPNEHHPKDWCRPGYFDFVLTNPPFGVMVESDRPEYSRFDTAHNGYGLPRSRQASEFLFIEQSLRWLKPGGTVAIVLPKSVLTNPSSSAERKAIGKMGFLKALIVLPPETFQITGTQTNTTVAIIQKYLTSSDQNKRHNIVVANVTNVGYDSTGRARAGNQLDDLATRMRHSTTKSSDFISVISSIPAAESLEVMTAATSSRRRAKGGVRLGDVAELISTGRTPPRAAYSENTGLFLIKVGNLTGTGMNWIARERNFIDVKNLGSRKFTPADTVQPGDIVLTSSAHSPVYIAKKVDIITNIPSWVGGIASFVGEVMRIRVMRNRISGLRLLGFLRQPIVATEIQNMVRGQTAHLHQDDIAELRIPQALLDGSENWKEVERILGEEASLNDRLNEIAYQQQEMYKRLNNIKSV